MSRWSEDQMPGSGDTRPNPVSCAMPTQPDHTSAAAGKASSTSGQDRTVPGRPGPVPVQDRTGDRSRASTRVSWSAVSTRGVLCRQVVS